MTLQQPRSTAMSADAAELVTESMACHKCGYDLRGLFVGGNCPECSTVITRRKKSADDKMGDAPAGYLNALASALLVFGLAGLVIPVGGFMSAMGVAGGAYAAMTSVAVLPIAGLVILRKRVRPHLKLHPQGEAGEWVGLRRACAIGYGVQYLLLITVIIHEATPLAVPEWIIGLLMMLALAGICLAAWHISLLADWARDYNRAMQLRACSMGFGLYIVYSVVTFLVAGPLAGLFNITPATAALGAILSLFHFIFSIFAFGSLLLVFVFAMLFASTVRWSIHNARTERERDARLAAKARKRAEELVARTAAASTAAAPAFVAQSPEEAGVTLIDSGADLSDEPDEDEKEYDPYGLEE